LNIDAPETKDPDEAVQCLGPEAAARLAELLPVGTPIRLEYDAERIDRYDRTLAAVFLSDGTLVNAEMARAGLAVPVIVGGNDRFRSPVVSANEDAKRAGRGLYSDAVACTLPGKLSQSAAAAATVPESTAGSAAALGSAADIAGTATSVVSGVDLIFARPRTSIVWKAFTDAEQGAFVAKSAELRARVQRAETTLRTAQADAAAREAAEVEAARKAQQREEQDRAWARKQAVEEKTRVKAQKVPAPPPAKKNPRSADAPSAGDAYPGYTGPRCYLPGGKTYRPC
jgi:micrococcal nuclease